MGKNRGGKRLSSISASYAQLPRVPLGRAGNIDLKRNIMKKLIGSSKSFGALIVILTLLINAAPSGAQELVSVSDITGGSSVFVFRKTAKGTPNRFVSKARSERSRSQRIETTRKVSKQYVALAKVTPRRVRVQAVQPNDPRLKDIPRMEPVAASKLFTGVGEFYIDKEDYNNAMDFFREAIQMDSKNTVAKTGLSEALALLGNNELVKDKESWGAAQKFFEEALTYNPKNAPAHFGLGEIFSSAAGKEALAQQHYESALSNDKELTEIYTPLGILYYQQGEIAKADDLLSKSLITSPNDPETQYFLGLIRFSQQKNELALQAFNKAVAGDPAYAEAYYQAGETRLRLNKTSDAIADFTKATTLKPAYFEAWLGLGSANYELNKWPEAVTAYKKATQLKNDNWVAYENLGDAYRQIPNYDDAEANYRLAALFLERSKDFNNEQAADIYSKGAFMLAKQCERNMAKAVKCRWDDAVTNLEKAAKYSSTGIDNSNLGWAYYNAARADLASNNAAAAKPKLEKARLALQKAAASNPKFVAGPLLNLGMALKDMGDYAGAEDALKKVLQREPEWGFALNELGSVYRRQNKYKEAAEQFRKAADKEQKNGVVQYNLGEAEFLSGNLDNAKKSYDKLKKMGRADLAERLTAISGGKVRG
jgi:tetratricopeptide (TPR) repeat protein